MIGQNVGHCYCKHTQKHNKTWALLQTKDEPNIVLFGNPKRHVNL